ncbi:hypothetical protein T439DRAFT_357791 [Meredithblackwellia eburnea MCA 4105]
MGRKPITRVPPPSLPSESSTNQELAGVARPMMGSESPSRRVLNKILQPFPPRQDRFTSPLAASGSSSLSAPMPQDRERVSCALEIVAIGLSDCLVRYHTACTVDPSKAAKCATEFLSQLESAIGDDDKPLSKASRLLCGRLAVQRTVEKIMDWRSVWVNEPLNKNITDLNDVASPEGGYKLPIFTTEFNNRGEEVKVLKEVEWRSCRSPEQLSCDAMLLGVSHFFENLGTSSNYDKHPLWNLSRFFECMGEKDPISLIREWKHAVLQQSEEGLKVPGPHGRKYVPGSQKDGVALLGLVFEKMALQIIKREVKLKKITRVLDELELGAPPEDSLDARSGSGGLGHRWEGGAHRRRGTEDF